MIISKFHKLLKQMNLAKDQKDKKMIHDLEEEINKLGGPINPFLSFFNSKKSFLY